MPVQQEAMISNHRIGVTISAKVTVLAAALVLLALHAVAFSAGTYALSGDDLAKLKADGELTVTQHLYLWAEAVPASESSKSHEAAIEKAGLLAKQRLLENHIRDACRQSKDISKSLCDALPEILIRNSSAKITMRGFVASQSGFDNGRAWVILEGPLDGVDLICPTNMQAELAKIMRDSSATVFPFEADLLYEYGWQNRLSGAQDMWFRNQYASFSRQLTNAPIAKALRFWVKNEKQVLNLNRDNLGLDDRKRLLERLPYSKRLVDELGAAYTQQGLTICAEELKGIKFVCPNTSDISIKDANSNLWNEAEGTGDSTNVLLRVIIAAQGRMPMQEESAGTLYDAAMTAYLSNATSEVTRITAFQALEESINANTLNLYGAVMRKCGFYHMAMLLCRQAETCNPRHPYAIINQALCMEALGRPAEASTLARRAKTMSILDVWGKKEADRLGKDTGQAVR